MSAGNTINITGYGGGPSGGEGGINGKYFVDKVTHKYTKSGGFTTAFECSGVREGFHPYEVGGSIQYNTEGPTPATRITAAPTRRARRPAPPARRRELRPGRR